MSDERKRKKNVQFSEEINENPKKKQFFTEPTTTQSESTQSTTTQLEPTQFAPKKIEPIQLAQKSTEKKKLSNKEKLLKIDEDIKVSSVIPLHHILF